MMNKIFGRAPDFPKLNGQLVAAIAAAPTPITLMKSRRDFFVGFAGLI
jgi:hypothetical protein